MHENRPLVLQLAHVLYRRNQIEIRRRRAKGKTNYYQHIKNTVVAYSNCQLGDPLVVKKASKWIGKISELNKRILKHKAEYMKARYDTAKLTCSTRKLVASLTKTLGARVHYQHGTGFVNCFSVKTTGHSVEPVYCGEFESMFKEVEATRAIENMLKGRYDK